MIAAALLLLLLAQPAEARDPRVRAEFMREHPCPATGLTGGPCRGFVVDHVRPLCAGGADHPSNMQWQRYEDSIAKDRQERAECRALRRRP